jgi:hypothetical protein
MKRALIIIKPEEEKAKVKRVLDKLNIESVEVPDYITAQEAVQVLHYDMLIVESSPNDDPSGQWADNLAYLAKEENPDIFVLNLYHPIGGEIDDDDRCLEIPASEKDLTEAIIWGSEDLTDA